MDEARDPNRKKIAIFAVVSVVALQACVLAPKIPQDLAYHDFADQRRLLGIANAHNVLSNLPFAIVGLWGLLFLWQRPERFLESQERWIWVVFFLGVAFTSIGSGYYHLDPSNATLVWDRLPMTIGFMGLFAALIGERIVVSFGVRLLPLLLLAGFGSVFHWYWTEMRGAGDLRPYFLVQFYPLVTIPLLLGLFPARYTRGGDFLIAVVLYMLAKLLELADRAVFDLGGVVSGHALKHVAAAAAAWWLLRMLQRRAPIVEAVPAAVRA